MTDLAVSCSTATALPLRAGRETCPVHPAPQDVDRTGAAASTDSSPTGEAFDAAGKLFTADNNRSAIREITPAAVVSTVAVAGYFSFQTGQQPPAGAARLPGNGSSTLHVVDSAGKPYGPVGCAMEVLGGP